MGTAEAEIVSHYRHGSLRSALLDSLHAMGKGPETVIMDDLAPVDEFHMGGRAATEEIAQRLALGPGQHLLDIGSGIGGATRFLASRYECRATGVDLNPEYIEVAKLLRRWTGLDDRVDYQVASATELPFTDACFDAATMLHVGMNIPDKAGVMAEARRVLRPGAVFVVHDVMQVGDGEPRFPVAWAGDASTSFLASPEAYRQALSAAGFTVESEARRTDLALEVFARMRSRIAAGGPPPLGLHILMGADAPVKVGDLIERLERGCFAPVELVARRG